MTPMVQAALAVMLSVAAGWFLGASRNRSSSGKLAEPEVSPHVPQEASQSGVLEAELDEVRKQLAASRLAAYNSRHALEAAQADADRCRQELVALRARAGDLDAKLRLSERLLAAATQARKSATDASVAAADDAAAARQELVAVQRRYTAELTSARAEADALRSGRSQEVVHQLRAEIEGLREELKAARDLSRQENGTLQQELGLARADLIWRTSEVDQLRQDMDELRNDAERRIAAAEAETARMQQQLSTARTQAEEYRGKLREWDSDLEPTAVVGDPLEARRNLQATLAKNRLPSGVSG